MHLAPYFIFLNLFTFPYYYLLSYFALFHTIAGGLRKQTSICFKQFEKRLSYPSHLQNMEPSIANIAVQVKSPMIHERSGFTGDGADNSHFPLISWTGSLGHTAARVNANFDALKSELSGTPSCARKSRRHAPADFQTLEDVIGNESDDDLVPKPVVNRYPQNKTSDTFLPQRVINNPRFEYLPLSSRAYFGRSPDYFRIGLKYSPERDAALHPFRTVHIGNLPKDINLIDVLAKVHHGVVFSATLLDTMSIIGSMAASIKFLRGEDAERFVKSTQDEPIYFPADAANDRKDGQVNDIVPSSQVPPSSSDIQKAEVILISTPTYPVNATLAFWITKCSYTRCLSIKGISGTSIEKLTSDIISGNGCCAGGLLKAEVDSGGTFNLEFSSIELAISAYIALPRFGYKQLKIEFRDDPCQRGVEASKRDGHSTL